MCTECVYVYGRDSVFVCEEYSNNVLQISEGGEKIVETLTKANKFKRFNAHGLCSTTEKKIFKNCKY